MACQLTFWLSVLSLSSMLLDCFLGTVAVLFELPQQQTDDQDLSSRYRAYKTKDGGKSRALMTNSMITSKPANIPKDDIGMISVIAVVKNATKVVKLVMNTALEACRVVAMIRSSGVLPSRVCCFPYQSPIPHREREGGKKEEQFKVHL